MAIIDVGSTGVVRQTYTQIRDGLEAEWQAGMNQPFLDAHSAESLLGNICNSVSSRLDSVCQLVETLGNSLDPDRAEGQLFEARAALVGLRRKQATKGNGEAWFTFNAAVASIPAGTILVHGPMTPDQKWTNANPQTIPSAGSYQLDVNAVDFGPNTMLPQGVLTVYAGPAALTSANAYDGDLNRGTDAETALAFRTKLEKGRQSLGSSPFDAFIADLESHAGVTSANAIETAGTLEPIIEAPGLSNAVLAGYVFAAKGGGIVTTGEIKQVITDSKGVNHAVYFSRTSTLTLYLWADIRGNPSLADVLAACTAVIVAQKGQTYVEGVAMLAAVREVKGVNKVTRFQIASVSTPAPGANVINVQDVVISARQIASLTAPNVTLVITP